MKLFSIARIISFAWAHKFVSAVIVVAVLWGGYWVIGVARGDSTATGYILGEVSRGTIIASVSASGQIAALDEADVKAKAVGDIVSVIAKTGQHVAQGQALATIDATEAQRAVVDAELAVEEARINLEHDTLQAPIDYKNLEESVNRASRDLEDAYEDAYIALSEAFVDLPDIVSGVNSILYDKDINPNVQNVAAYVNLFISADDDQRLVRSYTDSAEANYAVMRDAYTKSAATFKGLSRSSDNAVIEDALAKSREMSVLLSKTVVDETNMIDTVVDILKRRGWSVDPDITSAQSEVRGYVTGANNVLSNLTSAEKTIENARDALTDAKHELDLASVGNPSGDNPFDLKLLENTLKQKEAALDDVKQTLADHTIRAPFAGVLASFDIRRGDTVSNGGTVGSIITSQQIAQLSLNEVDAVKISVDDKATLTFDAVEDLTLTGEVAEIDAVGTVSQGVVSYSIKIAFDTQDERVKPGMTVNAAIQTDVRLDALIVLSSAVKTQGGESYVLVFDPPVSAEAIAQGSVQGIVADTEPRQIPVEIGISDDTNIEILSGLEEGDQVVIRTTSGSAVATPTNTNVRGGFGGIRF